MQCSGSRLVISSAHAQPPGLAVLGVMGRARTTKSRALVDIKTTGLLTPPMCSNDRAYRTKPQRGRRKPHGASMSERGMRYLELGSCRRRPLRRDAKETVNSL